MMAMQATPAVIVAIASAVLWSVNGIAAPVAPLRVVDLRTEHQQSATESVYRVGAGSFIFRVLN